MRALPAHMLIAMGFMMLFVQSPVRAEAKSADMSFLYGEFAKLPDLRNAELVDQKLAAVLQEEGKLDWFTYTQVHLFSIQNELWKKRGQMTADDVKRITDECRALIKEIQIRAFKGTMNKSVASQQLSVIRWVPDRTAADEMQSQIVDAYIAWLKQGYIDNAKLTNEQRADGAIENLSILTPLAQEKRLAASGRVYDMVLALDTPESRIAYVRRGQLKSGYKLTQEALKDYETAIADAKSPQDVKLVARYCRMQMMSGAQAWEKAADDAEALSSIDIAKTGGSAFGPNTAARAKCAALRVRVALGELRPEERLQAMDGLALEILGAGNFGAEEKSVILTDMMLEDSKDAAQMMKWEDALGYARAAYTIAPNDRVPTTIRQIQLLLANRSRGTAAGGAFNVTPNPDDMAKAKAFYIRQSGTKTDGDKTVKLAADLSNDKDFPRQLDNVAVPFGAEFKSKLEAVASTHPDPCTRALAQGMLGKVDEAIATIGAKVGQLGLEAPGLSELVNFTARFARAKLESVALANAFLQSQVHGPAGADGKMGTADDTPNPLTSKPH